VAGMAGAPNKADETKPNTTDFFGHLSIGEKSKLKWKGNRQELKSFCRNNAFTDR
jgi:hypothetical protein